MTRHFRLATVSERQSIKSLAPPRPAQPGQRQMPPEMLAQVVLAVLEHNVAKSLCLR